MYCLYTETKMSRFADCSHIDLYFAMVFTSGECRQPDIVHQGQYTRKVLCTTVLLEGGYC